MKHIKGYTEEQLQRLSALWYVQSKELQWKADKLKARLEKRLEREAKRHASLAPTRQLLANSTIILEALLPHGASHALELVRTQIAECEAKIHDVTYRYNLLSDEEIALKYMAVELAEMKARMATDALNEVELELASRVEVVATEEVEEAVVVSKLFPSTKTTGAKKELIELRVLRALRAVQDGFARSHSFRGLRINGSRIRMTTKSSLSLI